MNAVDDDSVLLGLLFCEREMIARGQQGFARDAADVQTSAAKLLFFFDKRGFQSKLTRTDRGDVTAGSRADDNDVKFLHVLTLSFRVKPRP